MFVTIKINVVVLAVLQSMSQCVYTTAEGARSVRIAESLPVVKTEKRNRKIKRCSRKRKVAAVQKATSCNTVNRYDLTPENLL